MATIQDIVNVTIERATNQATVRDLNTIAILTEHARFAQSYKLYTSLTQMTADGFVVGDAAYKQAQIAFSQNPRPQRLVVGKKLTVDTYVESIQALEAAFGQWLYLVTDATDAEADDIAAYIETTEKFYIHHTKTIPTANNIGLASDLKALGYVRTWVILNTEADQGVAAAGYAARFGTQEAGSTTWVYKEIVGLQPENLTPTQAGYANAQNLQWYTTIENLNMVYGNGRVVGGEAIDVMVGVQWIITRMREAVFGVVTTPRKLSFTGAGIAAVESAVRSTLAEAITRDILADDFTPIVVVPQALSFTPAQRNTRVLSGITFQARLAGAILAVDGINGTVFA